MFLTDGNNLIGDLGNATGFVDGVRSDQIGDAGSPIDPGLGPLIDNGEATLSHALLAGSPAIDAGDHTRAVRLNGRLPVLDEGTFAVAGVDSTVSSNGTVNINGPSVLRVPDWIPVDERPHAQANYYLYFANHRGDSIRMAWADSIGGPWTLFNYGTATDQSLSGRVTPGDGVLDLNLGADATIDLGAVVIDNHIASPDVRLDEVNQRIVMYFHSPVIGPLDQTTFVATSKFGLNFNIAADGGDVFPGETHGVREVALGRSYFKMFEVDGRAFALANGGKLFRGPATTSGGSPATIANADDDGSLWNPPEGFDLTSLYWEQVPTEDNPINKLLVPELLRPHVDPETDPDGLLRDFDASSGPRHSGVLYDSEIDPDKIFVYYSGRYDAPESVMLAVIDLSGLSPAERQDPVNWVVPTGKEALVFSPEENWEGIGNPFSDNGEPFSSGGDATGVQQLRDPDLYIDTDGLVYLFYSGAGEEAIGMALVVPQNDQSGNSRFGDVAADIGALEFTDDNAAWARHVIDGAIGGADGARFEDVNNDGLLDIAVGWEQSGISRAYLNPGPSGVKEVWPAVTVGVTPDVEDAVFADVDGDGAIDVISATEGGNRQLMVNFAPTDPADYTNSAMWTTVAFPTLSTPNAPSQPWMYSLVMDVNQDGNLDIVSGGKVDAKVGWFEAPEINKRDLSKWQYHEMGNVGWTMSLIESDMDGDGDSDIVLTDRHTDFGLQGARWLENPGSDGDQNSLWTNHFIGTQYEQTMSMTLADMDGDLDLDIVYPIANDQRVLWIERLDSTGDSWTEHVINGPANVGSGKAIEVADINNDGQLDLILSFANARNGKSGVVWLEYSSSVFDSDWVRHEISGPDGVKFDLVTMLDLDYDGDLDLVTTEEKGSDEISELGVIWYENPLGPNADTTAPVADLADPVSGGTIDVGVLNGRNYLDVIFADVDGSGLDPASIDGDELSLSGAGVGTAMLDGTVTLVGGNTYRYGLNPSGEFVAGNVDATFVGGSWQDNAGNAGVSETETFTVALTPVGVTTVRVRLTDNDYLQLYEVEVFERGTGTALDDSGTASQSSTYNRNTGAEQAIDGDTTSDYPSSLALTRKELGAWWQVDLSGGFDVETIVVYNRGVAGGRLEDAVVEALDSGGNVVWSDTIIGATSGSVHTFTVSDGSDNELPTLDALADLTIDEDAAEQAVNLAGITDGDSGTQPLRVTASSSTPSLIPDPTVTYTSPNATGSLAFTPVADQSGTATITVTVEDGGLDNDLNTPGDNATFSRTFDVLVTPVGVTTVRVRLTDNDYLQLYEVEVFERGTGTALDDSGTASQSSTYNRNTRAEQAIDGDTTSDYPSSLALTRKELGAWWQVDLSGGFDVETIVVYNRGVAGGRLEGAVVEALDSGSNVLWSDTITGASNGSVHTFAVVGSADSGADELVELPVSQADKAAVTASDSGWVSFVDDDSTAAEQDREVSKSPVQTTPVTTPDAVWISFVDDGSSDEQDDEDRPRQIAIGAAVSEPDESDQSSRINPGEAFDTKFP